VTRWVSVVPVSHCLRRLLHGARAGRRLCWRGAAARFREEGIDVLVRRRDDAHELPNGTGVTFADEALAKNPVAACDELHDCLVGLDFGQRIAALDGVALILEPLDQAPFFHRGRKRFHEDFRCHWTEAEC
jgi:hypothetical protein